MFLVLETFENVGKLGNIVSATKMFLNLLENIVASWKANFVSATMFSEVGKQGNIYRNNVSYSLPGGLHLLMST